MANGLTQVIQIVFTNNQFRQTEIKRKVAWSFTFKCALIVVQLPLKKKLNINISMSTIEIESCTIYSF